MTCAMVPDCSRRLISIVRRHLSARRRSCSSSMAATGVPWTNVITVLSRRSSSRPACRSPISIMILCPSVTLDEIVDEIREAVLYCAHHAADFGAAARLLCLVGHSAGAHLVARMLAQDWAAAGLPTNTITGAVALSGIYEPEVVLRLAANTEIGLTAAIAARHDCLRHPPQRQVSVLIAVGSAEPIGWIEQSRAYHDVCVAGGLDVQWMCVEGANHFTLLEDAMTAGSPLAAAMLQLVTGR